MNESRRIGSYSLSRVLGAGATGQVWEATDSGGSRWALKLLRSDLAEDQDIVRRFLAERSVLLGIENEHLVGMHDLVVEGGQVGIAMDLVEGGSLRDLLRRQRTLTPDAVAQLGAGIAEGLAALHHAGVVHRDVKPGNVMIDVSQGWRLPRLTDFGIAVALDSGETTARSTALIGTPSYLAPELGDGAQPSPSSDLYALGITMYELACGVTPFKAPTPLAMLRRHADYLPGRPDGLPDALWSVIAALLRKSPRDRPHSAAQLATDLRALAPTVKGRPAAPALIMPPEGGRIGAGTGIHEESTVLNPIETSARFTQVPAQGEGARPAAAQTKPGNRHKIFAAVGVLAVAVAAGATYAALQGSPDPVAQPTPASPVTVTADAPQDTPTPTTPPTSPPTSTPVDPDVASLAQLGMLRTGDLANTAIDSSFGAQVASQFVGVTDRSIQSGPLSATDILRVSQGFRDNPSYGSDVRLFLQNDFGKIVKRETPVWITIVDLKMGSAAEVKAWCQANFSGTPQEIKNSCLPRQLVPPHP